MHSNATRRQTWILGVTVSAIAVSISCFGLNLALRSEPILKPQESRKRPGGPWSEVWNGAQAQSVSTTVPLQMRTRPVTVRSIMHGQEAFILVEWHNEHPDLSYEGALYGNWLQSGKEMGPMTTLLRDEVDIWFGPIGSPSPLSDAMANESHHGHWVWRSQWQLDQDRNYLAKIRKEFGTPYVNYYPIVSDGAYGARYVGNTNAVLASCASCRWIVKPPKDVFTPEVTLPIQGMGQWRNDTWRVMFIVPIASLTRFGDQLEFVLSISDGIVSERKRERSISKPFILLLSPQTGEVAR